MSKSNTASLEAQDKYNKDTYEHIYAGWERLKSKMKDETLMDSREEALQDNQIISRNNPAYER